MLEVEEQEAWKKEGGGKEVHGWTLCWGSPVSEGCHGNVLSQPVAAVLNNSFTVYGGMRKEEVGFINQILAGRSNAAK